MKKLFVCAIFILTVFAGVFAQESVSEESVIQEEPVSVQEEQTPVQIDQVVIKFNVLDSTWTPKIYVSKYPNFLGKKLIATGSGEVTLEKNDSLKYIGFSRSAVQSLNINSDFLEFDVERGNPVLHKIGFAGTIIGCIACGVGCGLLLVSFDEGDKSALLPFGALAGSGLGIAIGGYVISNKNKPRLIPVSR